MLCVESTFWTVGSTYFYALCKNLATVTPLNFLYGTCEIVLCSAHVWVTCLNFPADVKFLHQPLQSRELTLATRVQGKTRFQTLHLFRNLILVRAINFLL